MKISSLHLETQDGLRQFCLDIHNDELMLDAIGSLPEHWAWMTYLLAQAPDREKWFPKGKWATIQRIQDLLAMEAKETLEATLNAPARMTASTTEETGGENG